MKDRSGKALCIMAYLVFLAVFFSVAILNDPGTSRADQGVDRTDLGGAEITAPQITPTEVPSTEAEGHIQTPTGPPMNRIMQPPSPASLDIADAGPDQTVNEGDTVTYDGTGSNDPQGNITKYEWDFDANVDSDGDGNTTNDIDATGPKPTHIFGDNGVYDVTLTVTSVRGGTGGGKVDQDVVLIIDSSGSMTWNDPDDIRIDAAKHYVYLLTPDDYVAVVDFDNSVTLLQKLTMNYYQAMVALDLIDSSGGTELSPALDMGIDELEGYGHTGHTWVMIVLTDAEGLSSNDVNECYNQANRAAGDDIIIYTIGLNIDAPQEKKLLEDIANMTGGTYYSPPNASHLYEIYDEISQEVENTTSQEVADSDTMKVTVTNVAPSITSFGPLTSDEGSPFYITTDSTDPGSDDLTFVWEIKHGPIVTNVFYNDGTGPDPYPSPGGNFPFSVTDSVSHTYGDNGIFPIILTVTDDDGGSTTYATEVTVNNLAPTIAPFGPFTVDEGLSFSASTLAHDAGSDDLTFTWQFELGPTLTNTYYNDGYGPDPEESPWEPYPISVTDSVDHTYGDNGVYLLTLTVEDDDGATTTYTTMVTVNNVAPSITPFGPHTTDEGSATTFSATSTDAGSDDLTFTWDWGDGTATVTTLFYNDGAAPDPDPSPWGTYPFTLTDAQVHTYGDNGVYTLTLTVDDDDGGTTTYTTTVTVDNVAPTIIPFGPFTVDESTLLDISATSTDPGSDDLTFTWTFEYGPTITNVHYNNGAGPDPYPSPWGTFPFSATDSAQHTYCDNGIFTITLTVQDDDGGTTTYSTTVTVNNVVPTIDPFGPFVTDEGTSFDASATSTDPGSDDLTFTWVFEYGPTLTNIYYNNGADPDPYPSPWGTYPFSAADTVSHTYGDNAQYTITLTVEDDDGGSTTFTTTVTVNNIAPTIEQFGPFVIDEGTPIDFTVTSTDLGSDDLTFTWEFEYGPTISTIYYNDGMGPDPYPSPLGNHPFTVTDIQQFAYGDNGEYEVTLIIEDDDGGAVSYTTTITVNNVAPTAEFEAYVLVNFTLRIAGEKWHDVRLYIYEDGNEVGYASVTRYPGSPDRQSVTISYVRCNVSSQIYTVVYYTPEDDPVNGQPNGANPCWLNITFADGSSELLKHTFNVQHPETWEWHVGINRFLVGHRIAFEATAHDQGSDDITFSWDWGDGMPCEVVTYFNDGMAPDPYPSPLGNYPCTAYDSREHVYTTAGNYLVILTITDDDGGTYICEIPIILT